MKAGGPGNGGDAQAFRSRKLPQEGPKLSPQDRKLPDGDPILGRIDRRSGALSFDLPDEGPKQENGRSGSGAQKSEAFGRGLQAGQAGSEGFKMASDPMNEDDSELPVPAEDSREEASAELTEADRVAAGIVAILDRLAERIPDLRPPDPEVALRARGARTVTPEFVSSAIAMWDSSPPLQQVYPFQTDKARTVLQYRDPYRLVADRLAMLLAQVNHTRAAQWAEVTSDAMGAYKMGSAIAEANPALIPHLAVLRRLLARTRGPNRKKKPTGEE